MTWEEQDDIIYFAREHIEGKTITEVEFSSERWQIELVTVLLKIVRALTCGVSQRTCHLNLKPTNIWITDAQDVKITDFYIPGFTNEVVLSPNQWKYLAPEIINGESTDSRSDIYSIGVFAYEIIARQHPYDMIGKIKNPNMARVKHLEKQKRRHHPKWDAIVMKAIETDMGKRFQSLSDLESELHNLYKELLTSEPNQRREELQVR